MGITLAMIGMGLMIGLAGTGSAIGLVTAGSSVIGALKKKPESLGLLLGMASPSATQGLYGFVCYIIYSPMLTPDLTIFQGSITLGAGLAVGIACLMSAIFQGRVCANGIAAFASGYEVVGQTFILAAFPEFYAILALIVAILMKGLII